jgi:hypothetical protein
MIVGMIWTVMQAFRPSVPSNLKELHFNRRSINTEKQLKMLAHR